MHDIPKIKGIKVLENYKLYIEFNNNENKIYDCSRLLNNINFYRLNNINYFKNVKVDSGGYGISWDSEIDLSEYELWKNGDLIS